MVKRLFLLLGLLSIHTVDAMDFPVPVIVAPRRRPVRSFPENYVHRWNLPHQLLGAAGFVGGGIGTFKLGKKVVQYYRELRKVKAELAKQPTNPTLLKKHKMLRNKVLLYSALSALAGGVTVGSGWLLGNAVHQNWRSANYHRRRLDEIEATYECAAAGSERNQRAEALRGEIDLDAERQAAYQKLFDGSEADDSFGTRLGHYLKAINPFASDGVDPRPRGEEIPPVGSRGASVGSPDVEVREAIDRGNDQPGVVLDKAFDPIAGNVLIKYDGRYLIDGEGGRWEKCVYDFYQNLWKWVQDIPAASSASAGSSPLLAAAPSADEPPLSVAEAAKKAAFVLSTIGKPVQATKDAPSGKVFVHFENQFNPNEDGINITFDGKQLISGEGGTWQKYRTIGDSTIWLWEPEAAV